MFVQCPRCQHALDAPAANVSCPRCGSPMSAPPAGGVVPRTMAMDPAMVAEALRASQPSAAPLPFAGVAPPAPQAPAYGAHAFATAPTYAAPPYAPQPYAPQPYGVQPFGAQPYGAQGHYGAPAQTGPSDRDLAGHAVISVVLSALAFLGACNPVGLAGVVVGLVAHNDANNAAPNASARTRTARTVAVVALVLTMLAWVVGVAVLLVAGGSA